MFEVSIEPYWSAKHDWIFENGAAAFLMAKIETKRFIHIWVIWRATELEFGIEADYPQIYYWHLFSATVGIFNFCDLGVGP